MKAVIMGLKDNRQVLAFVVLGLILVIFPNEMGTVAPYILGIVQILYGGLNIIISLKYPDASVSLGGGIISVVVGAIFLFQKGDSIAIIGVIWAMLSLYEASKEIDECRKKKEHLIVSIISIVVTIGLAVILMIDPFEHFITHVRILGLEMIIPALIRGTKNLKREKKLG